MPVKTEIDVWSLMLGYFVIAMTTNLLVDYKLKRLLRSQQQSRAKQLETFRAYPYIPNPAPVLQTATVRVANPQSKPIIVTNPQSDPIPIIADLLPADDDE